VWHTGGTLFKGFGRAISCAMQKELKKCPETPLLVGPLRVEFNTPKSLEPIKKDKPQHPAGRTLQTQKTASLLFPWQQSQTDNVKVGLTNLSLLSYWNQKLKGLKYVQHTMSLKGVI
ncbi:hypothetical protein ILYODFUR_024563, partial [Ilyodon furcidens]